MIITPLYAGLLAILYLALSYRVVQGRLVADGPGLGDGGNASMLRRIRGHANFAEYVPIILVLLAMLELGAWPAWLLHGLGAALLIARLLHGYALSYSDHFQFGRFWGTLITFVLLLVCGGLNVFHALRGLTA
ncbi:MAPEG family protein [bacterium]|nr:MAPEG family protein [bacterium]